jgi:hypothetical protein
LHPYEVFRTEMAIETALRCIREALEPLAPKKRPDAGLIDTIAETATTEVALCCLGCFPEAK